tara:strand:- start:69 stop:407 length:339 start_codon:yes stop_codon:yes gene_type:complete
VFVLGTCIDALFTKCKSRQEQVILVVGALVLATIGYFVGDWLFGFAGAARTSAGEIDSTRRQREYLQYMLIAYGVYGITMLLTASIAFVGVLNLIRLITGTGLADPGEDWTS